MISGEEEDLIEITDEENFYEEVRFSKDDKSLVALERFNNKIDIYNLETKELEKTFTFTDGFIEDFDFANNYLYISMIKIDESDSNNIENYILREKIY